MRLCCQALSTVMPRRALGAASPSLSTRVSLGLLSSTGKEEDVDLMAQSRSREGQIR